MLFTIATVMLASCRAQESLPSPPSLPLSPDYQKSYSNYASLLHAEMLKSYNKAVPPISGRSAIYSQAGTDVQIQLRFFKLESVDVARGNMRIKVWLRMKWVDQRLQWHPAKYGGITQIKLHAASFADKEGSDIWLPDVTAYNGLVGVMNSFDPAMAKVQHTGTVFWTRAGVLDVMCRFSGLASFPYGDLSCPIEIGGWIHSGAYQGIVPMLEGCVETVEAEEVSRSSYAQYSISNVTCTHEVYEYPCCPNEPWPVIKYRVKLQRTPFYYINLTILPGVVFTIMSFAVFFMSYQAGERLGYGVTLCLTSEVSKSLIAQAIPVCGELLWMELYLNINVAFTILSLLESCVVLGIAFNSEDYLFPPHLNPLYVGRKFYQWVTGNDDDDYETRFAPTALQHETTSVAANKLRDMTSTMPSSQREESGSQEPAQPSILDAGAKLIFFENLFYRLDPNGNGYIGTEDARRVLAFTSLKMTAEEFEAALVKADSNQRNGKLDCGEFVDLCVDVLWNVEIQALEGAASNYAATQEALLKRRNTKWRRMANTIDRHARFWVPFLYCVVLSWLFTLQLDDQYDSVSQNVTTAPLLMREAWGAVLVQNHTASFITLGIVWLIVCALAIVHSFGRMVYNYYEQRRIDLLLDSEGASSLNRAATTKIVPVTSSAADGKSTSTPNRHLAWPSGPDEFDVRNY
jgi:hypothetical protein